MGRTSSFSRSAIGTRALPGSICRCRTASCSATSRCTSASVPALSHAAQRTSPNPANACFTCQVAGSCTRSREAMMGIHPFGGLKMSGTNTKSGGPDYLQNFMEVKAVGEKL